MKTITNRREPEDIIAINRYPKLHAKGITEGEKIYNKGFPVKYLCAVMERCWLKYTDHEKSNAYIVGISEGYKEEELNDVNCNEQWKL